MINLNDAQIQSIKNQISMERQIVQKYQAISNMSENEKLKNVCDNITKNHKANFYKLKSMLNTIN